MVSNATVGSADDYEMMGYENKKNIHNHWNAFFVLDQKEFRTPHLLSVIGDNNPLTADALNPARFSPSSSFAPLVTARKSTGRTRSFQ